MLVMYFFWRCNIKDVIEITNLKRSHKNHSTHISQSIGKQSVSSSGTVTKGKVTNREKKFLFMNQTQEESWCCFVFVFNVFDFPV